MLRRYARLMAWPLRGASARQGSHVLVRVGSSRSYVPTSRELPAGTHRAILRQLGVSPSDLLPNRTPPHPKVT